MRNGDGAVPYFTSMSTSLDEDEQSGLVGTGFKDGVSPQSFTTFCQVMERVIERCRKKKVFMHQCLLCCVLLWCSTNSQLCRIPCNWQPVYSGQERSEEFGVHLFILSRSDWFNHQKADRSIHFRGGMWPLWFELAHSISQIIGFIYLFLYLLYLFIFLIFCYFFLSVFWEEATSALSYVCRQNYATVILCRRYVFLTLNLD